MPIHLLLTNRPSSPPCPATEFNCPFHLNSRAEKWHTNWAYHILILWYPQEHQMILATGLLCLYLKAELKTGKMETQNGDPLVLVGMGEENVCFYPLLMRRCCTTISHSSSFHVQVLGAQEEWNLISESSKKDAHNSTFKVLQKMVIPQQAMRSSEYRKLKRFF